MRSISRTARVYTRGPSMNRKSSNSGPWWITVPSSPDAESTGRCSRIGDPSARSGPCTTVAVTASPKTTTVSKSSFDT